MTTSIDRMIEVANTQLEFAKDLALRTQPNGATEQPIRKAFQVWLDGNDDYNSEFAEDAFVAGYMALLNELEPVSGMHSGTTLYALPEWVTKS